MPPEHKKQKIEEARRKTNYETLMYLWEHRKDELSEEHQTFMARVITNVLFWNK
jgi:hypothetical protein